MAGAECVETNIGQVIRQCNTLQTAAGPECRLARVCGQGSGKDGGLFPVVAAEGPQGFF